MMYDMVIYWLSLLYENKYYIAVSYNIQTSEYAQNDNTL